VSLVILTPIIYFPDLALWLARNFDLV